MMACSNVERSGVRKRIFKRSGDGVFLLGGHRQTNYPPQIRSRSIVSSNSFNPDDTVIGNDVWIGQNAVILPGVHIGDGAIIGANSVVGSDVAPYTIVVGNPAKVLRKRFDDELIDLLLRFKWWDKDIEEINSLIPLLTDNDLQKVKTEIKEMLD